MERYRSLTILLLAFCLSCNRPDYYVFTGRVIDPYTGKGIPKIYIACQGIYATSFMGGTEYFHDLFLDSTDPSGQFHMRVPLSIIDSFVRIAGGPVSIYRFGLEARVSRSLEAAASDSGYTIFSDFLVVDSLRFNDRNYLNRHVLVLTEKNERPSNETTGLSISLVRGAGLQIQPPADTDYIRKAALSVTIQELSRTTGKVLRQEELFFDRTSLEKQMLVRSHTPMNVILCKFYRGGTTRDTLTVRRHIDLGPGEVIPISGF